MTLFPERIDRDIAENEPVRVVNALIDGLDLRPLYSLCFRKGAPPYHPKMMLKAVIYGYICDVFLCHKIEERMKKDVHFKWLSDALSGDGAPEEGGQKAPARRRSGR